MSQQELELPKGWVVTSIEHCADILDSRRIPINSKERAKRIGKIPYYGATGQTGWINDFIFNEEIILVGEDGAPFLDFAKDTAYIISGKSWVNNHAHVVRAIDELTSNQLLCHYFNIFDYHEFITGTTRMKLNQSALKIMPVFLPPLNEQKRIVTKIEELFSKIDSAKKSLEHTKLQLEQYRASLLKSAFEGKLTEDWRNKNKLKFSTGNEVLRKIKETTNFKQRKLTELDISDKLYQLPLEWLWANIFDISTVQTGPFGTQLHRSDYTVSGTPIIEIGDVHPDRNLSDGSAHFISNKKSKELTRFSVCKNDILFTRVGTVGRCTIVPKSCNGWLMSTSLIRVRANPIFNSKFLFLYFISPIAQYFAEKTSKGSTRKGTNSKIVGSIPMIILSNEEQKEIVSQIEQGFSLIENTTQIVESSLQNLQTMKMSILKQAFEGKLVPQDPNDEPASVLLERIKSTKESQSTKQRGMKNVK